MLLRAVHKHSVLLPSSIPLFKVTHDPRTLSASSLRIQKEITYCLSHEGMQFCRGPPGTVAVPLRLCLVCTCALCVGAPSTHALNELQQPG